MSVQLPLQDILDKLSCPLCEGLFQEAVTIPECLHSFCRHCLLLNIEKNNTGRNFLMCPYPECTSSLGVYKTALSSNKIIYDRNLQSIVDNLFPLFKEKEMKEMQKFQEQEKIYKEKDNNQNNNNHTTVIHKKDKTRDCSIPSHRLFNIDPSMISTSDTSPVQKKRKIEGDDNVQSINKTTSNQLSNQLKIENNSNPQQIPDQSNEVQFVVKVVADMSCEPKQQLPNLEKSFRATFDVKMTKVQTFIYKRLPDRIVPGREFVEVLHNGEVLDTKDDLKPFIGSFDANDGFLLLHYRKSSSLT